ncbi:PLP-dependent transferase [Mrakia frigida]|uniref:PLP-dependent transferase n=1 Tax=Mrakia frigida TaxID=29902 RepID=UPI003FCC084F
MGGGPISSSSASTVVPSSEAQPHTTPPSPFSLPDYLSSLPPPVFGRSLRQYWNFSSNYVNLNHGSYGSVPLPVLKAMRERSDRIEENPDRFIVLEAAKELALVRERLAGLVNAPVDEVVVAPNATHAINTVLWNIKWQPGDIILLFTTQYGAIFNTAAHIADVNPGVTLLEIPLIFPTTHAEIVQLVKDTVAKVKKDEEKTGKKIKLSVVEAISSIPGVVMPWREICTFYKQEGILSVVDGAHELGQLPVDLGTADCDFWAGNAHKWLMSHRGGTLFFVPKRNQHLILSSFPTSAFYYSKNYPKYARTKEWTFVEQFDWTGTIDFSPFLSISPAMDFRDWLGGEQAITIYCHDLALKGGARMAELLGTGIMDNKKGELTANMVNVYFPDNFPHVESQGGIINGLLFEHNFRVGAGFHDGRWFARCSAQVFCDITDFEHGAKVIQEISNSLQKRAEEETTDSA